MTELPTFKLGRRTIVLGRHVHHDPRSRDYPAATGPVQDVMWHHRATILNQGQLGSCTGNAMAQCLGTDPLWHKGVRTSEKKAQDIYSLGTKLDDIPGQWPPTDTGCSGLGVGKAAKTLGYISKYTHAFGIEHAKAAIAVSPFLSGTEWLKSMFQVDANGFVTVDGDVEGGHEYEAAGYSLKKRAFAFINSWGVRWGVAIPELGIKGGGGFWIAESDYNDLLNAQGDILVPVV